jgi:hypothetical protein
MSPLASANFTGRLVLREVGAADYEFPAPASQEPDRASAEATTFHVASAATEPCGDAPTSQQAATAPEDTTPARSGAVDLSTCAKASVDVSEASHFILSLIAAHEGRSERDILAELIAAAGHAIGLSPLLSGGADDIEDLADLPGYARKAANRFRSGGP